MSFFKKKPPDEGKSGEAEGFTPQPEKARKWFHQARTVADSSNYEYALTCYANGIKLDPGVMSAHEAMVEAAVKFHNAGGKPASGRDVKGLDDHTPVGRFAAAEFEWMRDLTNARAAVKALDAAVKADQHEFGNWIAPRVFNLVKRNNKKLTKSVALQAMDLFRKVGAWDESLAAGEMAKQLDPTDAALDAELKNLSAQRAMDQGGYEQVAGETGGYRSFVKDTERQRQLQEEGSLSGGVSVDERNLARARAAYEQDPSIPDNINKYAQLVKKPATPEAEEMAREIYLRGFRDTGEYRFKMSAGDIAISQLERSLAKLEERLASSAGDELLRRERDEARRKLLEVKETEYTERVAKYPTDRIRKYELGEVQFELGHYDLAMAHFQSGKDEPKLRVRATHMLGRSFMAERWFGEAISEFDEALAVIDVTERDREMAIRYDLMLALIEAARADRDVEAARRAKTICSEIARRDITYRDIRVKRKEVDEVIQSLTA